jgi:hypothetical protein
MSKSIFQQLAPSLFLGLVPAATAIAQDFPDPLPPLPPAAAGVVAPVIIAPPALIGPHIVDSAALVRHQPKHVDRKRNSFLWRRLQGKALGYPEDFVPRPLGASVYDHGRTMVANGEAARLTLFDYDFFPGTNQLKPRGLDQLAKHAGRLAEGPHPLVIEPTPNNPRLAESRRLAVLQTTASWPFPIAPDRVLVAGPGTPRPTGLTGIEAQIIGANAMDRTAKYGPPIPILSNGVNSPSGVTNP